jgi:hypothetical protein
MYSSVTPSAAAEADELDRGEHQKACIRTASLRASAPVAITFSAATWTRKEINPVDVDPSTLLSLVTRHLRAGRRQHQLPRIGATRNASADPPRRRRDAPSACSVVLAVAAEQPP